MTEDIRKEVCARSVSLSYFLKLKISTRHHFRRSWKPKLQLTLIISSQNPFANRLNSKSEYEALNKVTWCQKFTTRTSRWYEEKLLLLYFMNCFIGCRGFTLRQRSLLFFTLEVICRDHVIVTLEYPPLVFVNW